MGEQQQSAATTGWNAWGRALRQALLCGAVLLVVARACPRGWSHDGTPLVLAPIGGELFFLQVPHLVKAGPDRLAIVRTSDKAVFEPHTYEQEGLEGPLHIEAWAQHLGAQVVFNAGQFDEKLHHLGWLKSRGQWLEPARKAMFQGLFVSGIRTEKSLAGAGAQLPALFNRIIDLASEDNIDTASYDTCYNR